jgi:kinesin family member 5
MSCIRVICRLRPENKIERDSGGYNCISYTENSIKIKIQERGEETHDFTFDRVFGSDALQSHVFEHAARPVVEGVLDGYNGTIFAYGQTGSGKTYTMEGSNIKDKDSKGIIPRMMDSLFEGMVNASESTEFTLRVSFLEIYLERIQDLLDSNKNNLQVKEDKLRGIYVHSATEIFVSSPDEMMKIMTTGSANRSIAATRMNERSSRSHSIFCVNVDQRDLQGNKKSGRLYFVDLAGSESVGKTNASGQQLKEAMMINKSLSALGNVINALTEKGSTYVPYRDSKLTRILQESIGGNSQTSLIIACSMSSYNDKETLSTLRFGQRAKNIQNKPIVNQERSSKELIKQINQLKSELSKQSEIINKIHRHIESKYPDSSNLIADIGEIINGCFIIESRESLHKEKNDSEYALTLLKQHIEIVKLNEELQTLKIEKKETEDELNYRSKEIFESETQINELQMMLIEEKKAFSSYREEYQLQSVIDKQTKDIEFLKSECELLSRQLDTKVKNIEEERASVALEMKYKDLEIQDLKEELKKEREKIKNFKMNVPQATEKQERLEDLCSERQKLFQEIVNLRRDLDLREEQLHNALQKNKRLERQISSQIIRATGSYSRNFSPNTQETSPTLTKKISKPIRGGGGNFSNFEKNNQINLTNDSLIKNRKSIEKPSNQGTGIQSMIKDLLGGLLG